MVFEHTTLTIDEERHLRLVYYAAKEDRPESRSFEQWLQQEPEQVKGSEEVNKGHPFSDH